MKRLTLCLGWLALAACDRTHMSAAFGKATREALARQVIDPSAGMKARPSQGLDPEEASIVSDAYRSSLAPPKEEASRAPEIFITQPGNSNGLRAPGAPGGGDHP